MLGAAPDDEKNPLSLVIAGGMLAAPVPLNDIILFFIPAPLLFVNRPETIIVLPHGVLDIGFIDNEV